MAYISDEESSATLSSLKKRQSYALLLFIGHALKQFASVPQSQRADTELPLLVSSLLEIVSIQKGSIVSVELKEIVEAAQWSLKESLEVISTVHFSAAALSMLQSDQQKVCVFMFLGL